MLQIEPIRALYTEKSEENQRDVDGRSARRVLAIAPVHGRWLFLLYKEKQQQQMAIVPVESTIKL